MKKTKLFSLLLAVAMMISMFAGCGGDKGGDEAKELTPAEKVQNAIDTTKDEFISLFDGSAYPELTKLVSEGTFAQDMGIYLSGLDIGMDMSDFYGTGIEIKSQSSYADRLMYAYANLIIGGHETLSYDVEMDDAEMIVRCADLLGNIAFTVNTETMVEDIEAATGESMEGMTSFNVFDLMDDYMTEAGTFTLSEATSTGISDAYDKLFDSANYDAPETATITCGETEIETQSILVSFSPESLKTYFYDTTEVMFADEYMAMMFESAAMTEGTTVEEMKAELIADIDEAFDGVIESLVLNFYIDDVIRGIDYVPSEGETVAIELRFGAENVYDNIELYIAETSTEDNYMKLKIAGNHGPEGDVFDSTTSFVFMEDGYEVLSVDMTANADRTTGDFTLDMTLGADGEEINATASGNALLEGDTYTATLDDFTIEIFGMTISLNGFYNMLPADSVTTIDADDFISVSELNEDLVGELSMVAQGNFMTIVTELVEAVPMVGYMIGM